MKNVFPFALVALSSFSWAEPPAQIDVSQLPPGSKLIDDVVVPVPSEIFNVLDKLTKPLWSEVLRTNKTPIKPTGDQAQIALLLGTVIAEGFIAVESKNKEEVKKIGTSVLSLSKALGVGKQAERRAKSITEAADKEEWTAVRRELDKALDDVKEAMTEIGSEPLSQLVSLGGWVRGTEALTQVVNKTYSKDGAELLYQPLLLDYFEKRLAGMKPKLKANPLVTKMQQGILDIRPLVGVASGTEISEKTVGEIGVIAADLVKTINAKAP